MCHREHEAASDAVGVHLDFEDHEGAASGSELVECDGVDTGTANENCSPFLLGNTLEMLKDVEKVQEVVDAIPGFDVDHRWGIPGALPHSEHPGTRASPYATRWCSAMSVGVPCKPQSRCIMQSFPFEGPPGDVKRRRRAVHRHRVKLVIVAMSLVPHCPCWLLRRTVVRPTVVAIPRVVLAGILLRSDTLKVSPSEHDCGKMSRRATRLFSTRAFE